MPAVKSPEEVGKAPAEPEQGGSSSFSIALQLVGAATGLAALITFVGGAILWIRFDALHLPADQALNLLPKQLLLVVGGHALLAPILVALLAGRPRTSHGARSAD